MPKQIIAVLIPCLNEATSISEVVQGFRRALPGAKIYVYDNGSDDKTAANAKKAGAVVRYEPLRGKGNVIRRMFAEVEADIYVMVDGDGTYDAAAAPKMIALLNKQNLDMVVAKRVAKPSEHAYLPGRETGGKALTKTVSLLFGRPLEDMLSGYRVFSRRFIKSFPALSSGFETETELTIHALELGLPMAEFPTEYKARKKGSQSKLRTISDGVSILKMILILFQEVRPVLFYGALFFLATLLSWLLAFPVIAEYFNTGRVPRFPTAILALGVQLLGVLFLVMGVVLYAVARGRKETKRLRYLDTDAIHKKGRA